MSATKTSQAYTNLKKILLDGEYRPGEQLRIDVIGRDLQVSVGAIREALARLTSDGLVRTIPQKGFVVAEVSRKDLMDVTDVRVAIEEKCLELSIQNGDVAWESSILAAYHTLSRTPLASEPGVDKVNPAWTEAHDVFHDSLIAACPNKWWMQLHDHLYIQAERYRRMAAPIVMSERDIDAEHKALMEAALDKDVARTQKLFSDHVRKTARLLSESDLFDA